MIRLLAPIASFFLPGLGLHLLGRTRLGWAHLAVAGLALLVVPYAFWLAVALWFAHLGLVLATLVVPRRPRVEGNRFWIAAGAPVVMLLLLRLVVRPFYVEAFKLPSGSMNPTLQIGDHIFVSKLEMRLRGPRRGEVIVFAYPRDPRFAFVSRVVAVGGDTIAVQNNTIVLNGSPVPREPSPGDCSYWDYDDRNDIWSQRRCGSYRETIDGRSFESINEFGAYPRDFPTTDEGPYTVPAGHVFVLGDNRNNSHDSRFWGPVPLDHVKGLARVVWWSRGGPEGVRWGRIGKRL